MRSLFNYERYRPAFADLFEEQRRLRPGFSTSGLAERIHVQPSHITNVIKGRSHFSSDQIYAIAGELGLTDEETDFLDQMMEWERADHPARKRRLLEGVRAARDRHLRAEKELKAQPAKLSLSESEQYYLDPNIELMHFYLRTPSARFESAEIAEVWGYSAEYVADILAFLQRARLIEPKRGKWHVEQIHQLLPSSSPLCKPQQMLKRLRAMETIQKLSADRVYSYTASITMTEETKLYIQGRFVEFLKDVEKAVIAGEPEALYHFQFDLFPWLATGRR